MKFCRHFNGLLEFVLTVHMLGNFPFNIMIILSSAGFDFSKLMVKKKNDSKYLKSQTIWIQIKPDLDSKCLEKVSVKVLNF